MSATTTSEDDPNAALWAALRSATPFESLVHVALGWKHAGMPREEGTQRLSAFLDDVIARGEPEEDAPVRKVLDLVAGVAIGLPLRL